MGVCSIWYNTIKISYSMCKAIMGETWESNEDLGIHGSSIRHFRTYGNNKSRHGLKSQTVKSKHASFCFQTGIGEFQRYLYYGHSFIICEPGTVRVIQQCIKTVLFNHTGITCNICGLIYVFLSAYRQNWYLVRHDQSFKFSRLNIIYFHALYLYN